MYQVQKHNTVDANSIVESKREKSNEIHLQRRPQKSRTILMEVSELDDGIRYKRRWSRMRSTAQPQGTHRVGAIATLGVSIVLQTQG
jgi:hypothetical protein